MRFSLLPFFAIFGAEALALPNVANKSPNDTNASCILGKTIAWRSQVLVNGGVVICEAQINGQKWILTTTPQTINDNKLQETARLELKEVYPVFDGKAIVGRFHLVDRNKDFGAIIKPYEG